MGIQWVCRVGGAVCRVGGRGPCVQPAHAYIASTQENQNGDPIPSPIPPRLLFGGCKDDVNVDLGNWGEGRAIPRTFLVHTAQQLRSGFLDMLAVCPSQRARPLPSRVREPFRQKSRCVGSGCQQGSKSPHRQLRSREAGWVEGSIGSPPGKCDLPTARPHVVIETGRGDPAAGGRGMAENSCRFKNIKKKNGN